jgi:hypothetical protein
MWRIKKWWVCQNFDEPRSRTFMGLEVAQVPTWKRFLIDNMGVGDKSHE